MATRRPGFGVKLELDRGSLDRALGALSPVHLSRANSRALQSAQKTLVRSASDGIVSKRFIKLQKKELGKRFSLSGSFRSDAPLVGQYARIVVSSKGENWTDFSPQIREATKRRTVVGERVRRVKARNQRIKVRVFGKYQQTHAFIVTGGKRPSRVTSVSRNTFLLKRTSKNAPRNSLEKFHMPAISDFMRINSVGDAAVVAARRRYNEAFAKDVDARIRRGRL